MALLKAGHWPTTIFPSNYWQEDYWPEYGTAAPATPTTVSVPSGMRRRIRRGYRKERLLSLMQQYLEMKVKQHDHS